MTITHRGAGSRALTHEDRPGVSRDLLPHFAARFAALEQRSRHLSDEVHSHRGSTRPPARRMPSGRNGGRAMSP